VLLLSLSDPADCVDGQEIRYRSPPPRFPELPGASTPGELNKALLNHFFLGEPANFTDTILLPFRECLPLALDEVGRTLARSSPSSATGSDAIPNSVWKWVHYVAPPLIHRLLAPLVLF